MSLRREKAHRFKSGSQPFIDDFDDYYVANITIGKPGQQLTVQLDTGSANLWVTDCACQSPLCTGAVAGFPRHCYNATASSSYQRNGRPLTIVYGSGWVQGYLGADGVNFGGFVDLNQTFGVATNLSGDFGFSPMDGILGLGWPDLSVDNVLPPLFQVIGQLDKPLFTVWLDRVGKTNCDPQADYVFLTTTTFWQFEIDSFSVGKSAFKKRLQAISDTGTSWLGLPDNEFEALISATGAEYNFMYDVFSVSCDPHVTLSLPDLVFAIGGKQYHVSSKEYVLDLDLGSNQCAIAAFSMGSLATGDVSIIFGDTFIRAYCNIYDIGQKRIGFAKAHHKEI